MNESILTSIKKLLGIPEEYEAFDQDIIIHINTFLTRLYQVGVGVKGFSIYDKSATWDQFLVDESKYQQAKTYVYLRVRLIFDPPTTGAASEAFKESLRELEWLLFVDADNALDDDEEEYSNE
jgi:hypothetical protein